MNSMFTEDEVYYKEDGLAYCKKCNTPRECRPVSDEVAGSGLMSKDFKASIPCVCEERAREKERRAREEWERREEIARNIKLCFKESAMREWNFENDNGTVAKMEYARKYVAAWDEVKKKNKGLMLVGDVGTGKTYMAACIANALLDRGVRVRMTDFAEISNISVFDTEERVKELVNYDLLIIDDFGAERKTEFALQNVFNVINRRIMRGWPLIITTNLTRKELEDEEDMTCKRIYDRVLAMCTQMILTGDSLRRRGAETQREELLELLTGENMIGEGGGNNGT